MTVDAFAKPAGLLSTPAEFAFSITPSDSLDLEARTRAVYVGATGDLVVRTSAGSVVTFASVPAGTLLPVRVDRVLATGTTADDILGLY